MHTCAHLVQLQNDLLESYNFETKIETFLN